MRILPLALAATLASTFLAGCNQTTAGGGGAQLAATPAAKPPGAVAAAGPQPLPAPAPGGKWDMPWQLTVASPASEAQGERTYVSLVENYGYVRGTKQALTYLNYPLETIAVARGRNRAVAPCLAVVEKEAKAKGAVRVEGVAAGPGRRSQLGYEGPVALRILYRKGEGFEVRQSILECKLDRSGVIRDAVVVTRPDSQFASLPPAAAPVRWAAAGPLNRPFTVGVP